MSAPSPAHPGARTLPRAVLAIAVLVLVAEVTILLAGAWRTGISYDEPYHVERLTTWFANGHFLLADDLDASGEIGGWVDDRYVYAPVTMLLAHAITSLLGVESWGQVSLTPAAFVVRHLLVALIALVGAAAAAALARIVTRSWGWGLVAAVAVLSVPSYVGLGMGNLKDVPVSTGYTLFTLGLVLVLRAHRRLHLAAAVLLQVLGALLAMGTRPGMWPAVAAGAGLAFLLIWSRRVRSGSGRWPGLRSWFVLLPVLGAWALLALIHPAVFAGFEWLMGAVSGSGNYRGRTAPRAQLMVAALVYVPTGILLLTCAAASFALLRRRATSAVINLPALSLVVLQGVLMPMLSIVTASFVQGVRQVLFVVPAWSVIFASVLAVAATHAAAWAADSTRRTAVLRAALPVALSFSLVAPVATQALAFPHGHALVSGAGAAIGVDGRDYWQMSVREAASEIPDGLFVVCSPFRDEAGNTVRRSSDNGRSAFELGRDCRTDYLSPFAPFTEPAVPVAEPVATSFVGIESESTMAPNCEVVGRTARRVLGQSPRLARILVCDLVLPAYPAGGLTFPRAAVELPALMGGWTGLGDRDGARMREVRADVGVAWAGEEPFVAVALDLDSEIALEVLVDNEPAFVVPPGRGWVRATVARGHSPVREAGLVVTLREVGAPLAHLGQEDVRRGGRGLVSGNVVLEEVRVGKDAEQVGAGRDVEKWGAAR